MARIAGVDLPREKQIHIGLTYIYGIGRPLAAQILKKAGVTARPASRTCGRTRSSSCAKLSSARR